MAVVGELVVAVLGNTAGLSSALAKSEAELKGFSAAATSHGNVASTALRNVGVVGAAVAVGATAIGVASVDAAAHFQEAMTTVQINAHLSETAARNLGLAIEGAAVGTTSSATEMVGALGPVAGELQRLSGHALTASDALLLLRAAEALHVATGSDLATSTKSIADILLTYHLRASDATNVSNLLFAAKAQLGVGVDFLSGALQKLQPRIAGSGVDLGTMLAIAREMEPSVGTGQRAILKLGAVLQAFLSPSTAAQKALASIGVSLTDAQGKFVGFPTAIGDLHAALADVTPAQRAADLYAIFGKNANLAAVLVAQGAPGLASNAAALANQSTAAAAAAAKNQDLANKGIILQKSLEDASIALGTALIPALTSLADKVLPVIQTIVQWVQLNPQLAGNILLVAGAIGVLLPVLGLVATIVGALSLPVLAVAGAIALLALAWANNWLNIRGIVAAAVGFIGAVIRTITTVVNSVGTSIGLFAASATQIWNSLATTAGDVAKTIGDAWTALIGVFGAVRDAFVSAMADMVHTALSGVVTILNILAAVPGPQQGLLKQTAAFYNALLNPTAAPVTGVGAGGANIAHGGIGVGAATTPLAAATAAILGSGKLLPTFQHGGTVPGMGPVLAMVHGGETVLPPGGGGQPTIVNRTIQLVVDGRTLAEIVDRELFHGASGFTSGFQAGNPVTGA